MSGSTEVTITNVQRFDNWEIYDEKQSTLSATEADRLRAIEILLYDFGPEQVAGATYNKKLEAFCDKLRAYVQSQSGSQAFKDMAMDIIDSHQEEMTVPVSHELEACMASSGLEEAAHKEGSALADDVVTHSCSAECSLDYDQAFDNVMYSEASKLEREKRAEAGGAEAKTTGGTGGGERSGNSSGNGGGVEPSSTAKNWLVHMAYGLAMVQDNFLDEALDNLDVMRNMSEGGIIQSVTSEKPF